MAAPPPTSALPPLGADGRFALPWYRWFQGLVNGSNGVVGPPGPPGEQGPAGPPGAPGGDDISVTDLLGISALDTRSPTFRLYGDLAGKPTAGQELFAVEMAGDEFFPQGLPNNLGSVAVAPTGSVTFPITVNGSSVGSMNIAASATVATWTFSAPYQAAQGDILRFLAPAPADATLDSPRYTFIGTRA